MTDQIIENTKKEVSQKNQGSLSDLFFNVQLLNDKDLIDLQKSCNFIIQTYESVPMFRPLAVKVFGVLSDKDFPTSDLKYNQCKIEAEVHANELVRELHELQIQKLHIEKAEYCLQHVMKKKYDEALMNKNEDAVAEINFDMIEQQIIISKKRFEFKQLEKKIKYRIMEINEWRELSDVLLKAPDFKNKDYNSLMIDIFTNDYNKKLEDPNVPEDKKLFIKRQLELLNSKTQ